MEQLVLSGFADEISPDLEQQIQVLNSLGIEYIEIRGVDKRGVDTYTAKEVKEIKKRLNDGGIRVSSLASPIGKIEITDEFSGHLEHFKHVVELAHILDAPYVRMFSFFIPRGGRPEAYRDQVFERLEALITAAASAQVTLLHENEKDIYGDSPERCRELMDAFSGEHFKAVFDFANFVQCGHNPKAAYEMLSPYIAYVHIKDARASDQAIVPPGQGDGKIKEILGDMKVKGYRGFVSLEPHLTEFEGLKDLERDGTSLKGMKNMSGQEAFSLAYQEFQKILAGL